MTRRSVTLCTLLVLVFVSCDSAGGSNALDPAAVFESWCQRETYCNPDANPEGVCIAEQLEWFDAYYAGRLSGENLERCKDAQLELEAYESGQDCGDSFIGTEEWIGIIAEIMIACNQCLESDCVIGQQCFGGGMRCGHAVSGEEIVMYCCGDGVWIDDGKAPCEGACEDFASCGVWHPACSENQQ